MNQMTPEPKKRGFAAMSPERRKEISSKGGRMVPPEKRAYSTNRKLAADSGRKGCTGRAPESHYFATNPEAAVEAGYARFNKED